MYAESKKNGIGGLICKVEIETQTQRTNVWIARGNGKSGRNWEVPTDIYTLLILRTESMMGKSLP